jgi:hypothetical protein
MLTKTDVEKVGFVMKMITKAYPRVPDVSESMIHSKGAAFMGYDNYIDSVTYEQKKLIEAGCADSNYFLEKITSMRNRHKDAIRMLDCAEEALTGKNPKTL